jgi:hypothetical protein
MAIIVIFWEVEGVDHHKGYKEKRHIEHQVTSYQTLVPIMKTIVAFVAKLI